MFKAPAGLEVPVNGLVVRAALPLSLFSPAAGGDSTQESGVVAIVDVTVFDGTTRSARPNQTIIIRGDRVAVVGSAGSVAIPWRARVVAGRGKFVVPGFWDLHVHLTPFGEEALPLFIANGVTSVRDAGGVSSTLAAIRDRIDRGLVIGPRLTISGPILDGPATVSRPEPLASALRYGVPDSAAGRRVVDSLVALGVDQIKVHSELARGAYFAVVERAKERGLAVIGHVPDEVTALEAVQAGQHAIEHQFGVPDREQRPGDGADRVARA